MDYANVRSRPKQFLAVTSVTSEEFDELLPIFQKYLERKLRITTRGTVRLNAQLYPKVLPSAVDFLFFTLCYLKNNSLQEFIGASFNMSQSSASRYFKLGLYCLNAALSDLDCVPCRDGAEFAKYMEQKRQQTPSVFSLSEQQKPLPSKSDKEEHYFIDVSASQIERSKDDDIQKDNFSGKHKQHEVKNTFICDEYRQILYLGLTTCGAVHDKKMAEQEAIIFPQGAFLWKDLGYLGFLPEMVECFELFKKPKNGELTLLQKQENTAISSVRMVIEHAIGGVKRCRIIKDIMRFFSSSIRDSIIETCTALHNFRNTRREACKIHPIFN